jgi:hypothetical protein
VLVLVVAFGHIDQVLEPVVRGLGLLLVGNGSLGTPTQDDFNNYKLIVPNYLTLTGSAAIKKIKAITELASTLQLGFGIVVRTKRRPRISMGARIQGDEFGKTLVNLKKLNASPHILELRAAFDTKDHKEGDVLLVRPVSAGVRHLLLNKAVKTQAGTKYTAKDLEVFTEIAKAAGAYLAKHTNKSILVQNGGVAAAVFIEKDPKRMAERLETLVGLKEAGKDSTDLLNEAMVLADALLRTRHISKPNHQEIFEILMS